ncbi:hypothetical protein AQ490_07130 [Wenjunlia vitaminophila]|uniref:Uncharacterized protein n=1 Tax=Wenjunlia vitaminophila TaxID=76728 RepID=A0A0T6LN13_WENVI|nr:DUF5326 family protein [Wenjunlia vitaminophila]KRV47244.1 hypothetical protein AQ490_07130 [Wenjunlia vitaminophila]
MKKLFARLPAWVRWALIPALALLLFGSVLMSVISLIVGLLFKLLLLVALVAAVLFAVKKFTSRT